jgi:hypothetical protein
MLYRHDFQPLFNLNKQATWAELAQRIRNIDIKPKKKVDKTAFPPLSY